MLDVISQHQSLDSVDANVLFLLALQLTAVAVGGHWWQQNVVYGAQVFSHRCSLNAGVRAVFARIRLHIEVSVSVVSHHRSLMRCESTMLAFKWRNSHMFRVDVSSKPPSFFRCKTTRAALQLFSFLMLGSFGRFFTMNTS